MSQTRLSSVPREGEEEEAAGGSRREKPFLHQESGTNED